MARPSDGLDNLYASLLANRQSQGRLRRLTLPPPDAVDFSSNSYLSLASDNDIKSAYLARLRSSPHPFALGSGGSRLLDGNTPLAEALEHSIAAFHRAPCGLLFNSGFEANTGLFSCAPQSGDVVLYDELIHASVHDGMKLGRARRLPFAHNRIAAGPSLDPSARGRNDSLEALLLQLKRADGGLGIDSGTVNVFIAVEAVYSMDGDLAPLKEIVDCLDRHLPRGNGRIIVDEAHSTGWLGHHGRGLVCHLGLEHRIWARVHTFGKAMGCAGAIVLSSPATRDYLINYARSFIYTTAMGFPVLAGIQTVYQHLADGLVEPHIQNLQHLMQLTHRLLVALVSRRKPGPEILRYNSHQPPESPIIPLFTPHARDLALVCQQGGYTLRPIVAPTVPAGTDRVRLCLHAGNTADQVQGLCDLVERWVCQRLQAQGLEHLNVTPPDAGSKAMEWHAVQRGKL